MSAISAMSAARLGDRWRRFTINHFGRRDYTLAAPVPYVSFTFDDFPLSAFTEGGRILSEHHLHGTYFVSLKLLGSQSPSGRIAEPEDLNRLLQAGHELGCHTYAHLDGRTSTVDAFQQSIDTNRMALSDMLPSAAFQTFAYPLDGPGLSIKRAVGGRFVGCRGGGQTFNTGVIDLNLLKAYFLDWRNRANLTEVAATIERNTAARGWLIFATHDVSQKPSRYGCDSELFRTVVRLSLDSGARILSMKEVLDELRASD